MLRSYAVKETFGVAAQAAAELEAWLRAQSVTQWVRNVEQDKCYQAQGVDLLWQTERKLYRVEIKADRHYRTGNFFFETLSNVERGSPGCFLYTRADLFFYYYLEAKRLFILPLPQARDWFLAERARFRQRDTTTPIKGGHYTTRGHLVPRAQLLEAVPGCLCYHLPPPSLEEKR